MTATEPPISGFRDSQLLFSQLLLVCSSGSLAGTARVGLLAGVARDGLLAKVARVGLLARVEMDVRTTGRGGRHESLAGVGSNGLLAGVGIEGLLAGVARDGSLGGLGLWQGKDNNAKLSSGQPKSVFNP